MKLDIFQRGKNEASVKKGDVCDELFARESQLHLVANTATGHHISGNVALRRINPVNAGIFHFGQPFCIRAGRVRGRLSTIRTVLLDYFSNLLNREGELPPKSLSPTAIFTMNSACPGLGGTCTRETDTSSKPAIFPITASSGVSQITEWNSLFAATSAAHPPEGCLGHTPTSSFSEARPLMGDNRKMPKRITRYIYKFHVAAFYHASIMESRGRI